MVEESLCGDYVSEKLFDNRRVILARRGHPLRDATSLAELVGVRWVATSVTMNSKAELSPLFARHGLPKPVTAVEAQSALSTISVAAASDVLAMLPQQGLGFARRSRLLALRRVTMWRPARTSVATASARGAPSPVTVAIPLRSVS